ncbi:MAG: restriction endonuclease subunit S [Actinomycetia bacterium]|nr:restriction endonuclease subunit S [Actinomycetes bacterium]
MIRGSNLSECVGVRLEESELVFVPQRLADKYPRSVAKKGDLVFTCWGTVGQLGIIDDKSRYPTYLVSNKQMKMTVDRHRVLPLFLYYYLSQPRMISLVRGQAIGSSVPGFNLGQLKSLPVSIPRIEVQRAISDILGALDDKIAANEKVIDAAGLALQCEASLLWLSTTEYLDLGSLVTVINGVSYKSADLDESDTALVTLKSVSRDGEFAERGFKAYVGPYRSQQEVVAGDLVVAKTDITQDGAIVGRAVRVPKTDSYKHLVASLDLAIVRPAGDLSPEFILAVLRRPEFRSHCRASASGTTVLHLGRGAIESFRAPVVDPILTNTYCAKARAFDALQDAMRGQNLALSRTRDQLLPLLMSGKIRVKDIEAVASEVL